MFDTHCHLNFKAFRKNLPEVIERARKAGVNYFVIPGTDLESSKRALEIAEKYEGVYAAVGIHPHHVFDFQINQKTENRGQKFENGKSGNQLSDLSDFSSLYSDLSELEKLIAYPKVVAIGEIGLDKHQYIKTKYQNYQINSEFIEAQKELLVEQLKLAVKYKKSVILHNREAKEELLRILTDYRSLITGYRVVFHCCETDDRLLDFAIKHNIFIGVDGDVTYNQKKQLFVKKIPLSLLVLETDSPFLLPEPLRSKKAYPNEPKNLALIAGFIARLKNMSVDRSVEAADRNSKKLFSVKD